VDLEIDNLLDVVHSLAQFPLNCQSKLAHELNEVISVLEMGHCTTSYRTDYPFHREYYTRIYLLFYLLFFRIDRRHKGGGYEGIYDSIAKLSQKQLVGRLTDIQNL
jgi:hypothetical protein